MDASASESLDAPGCQVTFSLELILADMEGGRYVGPILSMALEDLVSRAIGRGGVGSGGGSSSNGIDRGGDGRTTATKRKSSTTGTHKCVGTLRRAPVRPVPSGQG